MLHPGAPLPPEDGTVTINKYICDGLETVTWGGTPNENCAPGAATFYFYLIGDGSDEFWTATVDGTGSVSLTPGTYEVYEGNTWTMSTVEVLEGQTTTLNVLNPGAPLTGTATISKYVCAGVETVTWGGTPDENCDPAASTFHFYLIGDGTDEFWTLNVDGTGTIELPEGSYEVWENGYWTQQTVDVVADQDTALTVLNPGGPLPGNVTVNKFVCEGQTGVVWNEEPGADCVEGSATFVFYLIGDGTDDFWTLDVNGSGTIELPAGTYEVWEDGSWTMSTVEVTENGTTTVNVLNPAP